MARSAEETAVGGAGLVLVAGSLLVALAAFLLSFRVPFPAFDVAVHANAGRMLAAAAAGMAFAVAAVLRGGSGRALREAYVFALAIGGAAGIGIGLKLVGGAAAGVAVGVAAAVAAIGLVRVVDGQSRFVNFGLALVLVALFVVAIPAYLAASTDYRGLGGVALWLLGDVSRAHGAGAVLAFVLATVGCAAAAWNVGEGRRNSETPAILLVGLGVGIAGPVAFVGWAAASLARAAAGPTLPRSRQVILAAVAGAALLMLADAVSRFLVGGYAPPLNVTIAFVAIPAFLWWNRRRLRNAAGGRGSWVLEGIEALVLVSVAAGFLWFAQAFASFVRMAT